MKNPLFTTARLKIRNLRETDLIDFHEYRSNPDVTKYQGFDTYSKEDSRIFIADQSKKTLIKPGEWIQFGIEHIERGRLIGDCAIYLRPDDSRIAETGITISHRHQKNGYARETMLGLLKYLFMEKGVHRIVETVDAENAASIKMLENLSFRKEGHFIENVFFKGKWGSEYQYAMLKEEWRQIHGQNSKSLSW